MISSNNESEEYNRIMTEIQQQTAKDKLEVNKKIEKIKSKVQNSLSLIDVSQFDNGESRKLQKAESQLVEAIDDLDKLKENTL